MSPILFVPGLLCSAEVFSPQVAALWPSGPTTVANTLGGDTIGAIAQDILRSAPPTFSLCGISMGGYVCFEIMRLAPQRVTRLALLDTSARPDTPEQTAQRKAMLEQAEFDFQPWAEAALASILHPAHQKEPTIAAVNRRMALAVGLDGFRRQTNAAITRLDSRPGLAAIDVPTLVLVGDADPLTPAEVSREIAGSIGRSTLTVLSKCGHGSTLEQPGAVNAALVDWMKS